MNAHEQRTHRSVTQALDKRVGDAETLITALDARLMDLTAAVEKDLLLLKSANENSYFEERNERQSAVLMLSAQIADIQAWRARTYRQRVRDFFKTLTTWRVNDVQ